MPDPAAEPKPKQEFPPLSRLWQVPAMVLALFTFAVAGYIARHSIVRPSNERAYADALKLAYDSGNTARAVESAERFLAKYPLSETAPLAKFVLAKGKWTLIKSNPTATKKELDDCLSLLSKSVMAGLPQAYEAEVLRAQGDILMRLDLPNEAADSYATLLEKYPSERTALLDLAAGYARMYPPESSKAKEAVGKFLSFENLSPAQSQDGYLAKAQLELSTGDFGAAEASAQHVLTLKPQPEAAARAALIIEQALAGQNDYAGALKVLDGVDTASAGRFEGPLMLARGICLWKNGDRAQALKAFEETVFRFPGTSAALSARFELARLFHESGQVDAARDALVNLLDDMSAQQSTGTEIFNIGDATELWFSIGQAVLDSKGYAAVRNIHSAATVLMSQGHFLFFDATLYLREAEQAEASLSGPPSEQRAAAQAQIRQLYHKAGVTFNRVLDTASSGLYSRALFEAGHAFFLAEDYPLAARFLREFSAQNPKDVHVPQAAYEEASALQAIGNYEQAIRLCRSNAQQHPTNIYSYRSILLQADLYYELGGQNMRYAAQGYGGILTDGRFLATSAEWRCAIFSLGKTLYFLGDYAGCVLKLEEALERFPDDPQATEAQYYLGLASRQVAFSDSATRELSLQRAAAIFARLAATGNTYSTASAFLEADCYYDLGDYQKALTLYDRAVEAHVDTSDATRALFQMANCYHRLGRRQEADATYKRAVFNLNRTSDAPAPGSEFYKSLAQWRSQDEA